VLTAGATTTNTHCIPQGACFVLTVNDAGGNGITGGGWVLRDNNGRRIIDNVGNGTCFGSASVSTNASFCNEPSSTNKLIASDCDRENYAANDNVTASPNAAVSAEWGIGNQTDDGYQFWFFDPCGGGYSRRIFRNHASSGGFGPANAVRATKLALDNIVTNPLPANTLLNVRVRSRVNGVNSGWGPACRFRIANVPCPATKLIDTPNHPNFSCGVVRSFGYSDKVSCFPVTGANKYRFRFEKDGGGFVRTVAINNVTLVLSWVTLPLVDGDLYNVTAQASFDGGATYCPYGAICQVQITNPPVAQNRSLTANESAFRMYPNPNNGDQVVLQIGELPETDVLVTVDIVDVFGKRVMSVTETAQNGSLNTVLALDNSLASGMYTVQVTAGETTFTERLVINK